MWSKDIVLQNYLLIFTNLKIFSKSFFKCSINWNRSGCGIYISNYKIAQESITNLPSSCITNLRRYYKSAQLLQICAQQGLFPKIVRTPPYPLLRISIFRNCTPLEYHQNFHHPLDFFCFFLFIILLETLGKPWNSSIGVKLTPYRYKF